MVQVLAGVDVHRRYSFVTIGIKMAIRWSVPETRKDWDRVMKAVERQIDSAPKDEPVNMATVCKFISDNVWHHVSPTVIRNNLLADDDYRRYLRTFIPLAVIEQIEKEAVTLTTGELDILVEKYRDIYGKRPHKGNIHNSLVGLIITTRHADRGTFAKKGQQFLRQSSKNKGKS